MFVGGGGGYAPLLSSSASLIISDSSWSVGFCPSDLITVPKKKGGLYRLSMHGPQKSLVNDYRELDLGAVLWSAKVKGGSY